jgi:hypothetical protein
MNRIFLFLFVCVTCLFIVEYIIFPTEVFAMVPHGDEVNEGVTSISRHINTQQPY